MSCGVLIVLIRWAGHRHVLAVEAYLKRNFTIALVRHNLSIIDAIFAYIHTYDTYEANVNWPLHWLTKFISRVKWARLKIYVCHFKVGSSVLSISNSAFWKYKENNLIIPVWNANNSKNRQHWLSYKIN